MNFTLHVWRQKNADSNGEFVTYQVNDIDNDTSFLEMFDQLNEQLIDKGEETTYMDGYGDGLWTYWYENGQMEQERTYKDGKSDGLFTWWYENGQKRLEGTYKDGEKDGKWIYYNEDGSLKYVEEDRHRRPKG